ncbi:MAG: hypothetical protein PUC47_05365, partial [Oscillospiraceae bacterium]|nr:hypothetical protein [Oscillospiraceae bacterium]
VAAHDDCNFFHPKYHPFKQKQLRALRSQFPTPAPQRAFFLLSGGKRRTERVRHHTVSFYCKSTFFAILL